MIIKPQQLKKIFLFTDYVIPPDRSTSDRISDSLVESNDVNSLSDETESNELDTTSADAVNHLIEEIKDEEDIAFKSAYLMKLLLVGLNNFIFISKYLYSVYFKIEFK